VVFLNGTLSGKSESVNERTHTDQQKIKFHVLGVHQSADELISTQPVGHFRDEVSWLWRGDESTCKL